MGHIAIESVGWQEDNWITSGVEYVKDGWIPPKAIIVIDGRNDDVEDLATRLLKNNRVLDKENGYDKGPSIGVIVVGEGSMDKGFNPNSALQIIGNTGMNFEKIVAAIQPDFVISSDYLNEEALRLPLTDNERSERHKERVVYGSRRKKHIERMKNAGSHIKSASSSGYPVTDERGINLMYGHWTMTPTLERDDFRYKVSPTIMKPNKSKGNLLFLKLLDAHNEWYGKRQYFAPMSVRWNGDIASDDQHPELIGVKGVMGKISADAVRVTDESNSILRESKWRKVFAEYDVAVGSFGFYAGLIGTLNGLFDETSRGVFSAALACAPALEFLAFQAEARVKSEKWKKAIQVGEKFLGSFMAFAAGALPGMAIGGMFGVAHEVVGLSSEAIGEIDAIAESHTLSNGISESLENVNPPVVEVPVPTELTWESATAYYEELIPGEGWVSPEGITQEQVMAHKALIEHGVEGASRANEVIRGTESYEDYMRLRSEGLIYQSVGN